ncbi:hypothetical protein SCLCIDRAFT_33554 [Scleroderma citrinum Foug A]|uniref:Uncharacterized protein n=1 Tax=Scleroderma citrinum Foug A TaxID=1036808 RepID=A0A0C2YNI5_9AGAM|nr:hypothetical protein SCLCIDRAFT_33554 [Scleroderma citrinum Foug A]
MPSSILSIVAPKLPRHPRFKGLRMDRITVTRPRFDTAALMPWSVDLLATFGVVSGWLRGLGTSVLFRFDLGPIASMPGSMDLTGTYRGVSPWLRSSGTFQPYRFDLVSSASMPGSNDPTGMFRNICGWLRHVDAYPYGFDSSVSPSTPDASQRFFHSHRVNAAAARCAAFVAISPVISVIAISIAIAIASPLALNTRRNCLVSALNLSKLKRLGIAFSGVVAVSVLFPMQWLSVRALDASAWFPQLSGSSGCPLEASTAIFASVLMCGVSVCPVGMSMWLPSPSVSLTSRFESPTLRYVPTPSPWSITSISALFNVLGASICALGASAWLLDIPVWQSNPSVRHPGPFTLPAHQFVPPMRTSGLVSPSSTYSSTVVVRSSVSSFRAFPRSAA